MDKSIMQKLNITPDQHYVQQWYLHNWDNDNQLFYIDKKYNKLINKGTKSVVVLIHCTKPSQMCNALTLFK